MAPNDPDSAPWLPSTSSSVPVSKGAPTDGTLVSEGDSLSSALPVASKGAQNVDFSPSLYRPSSLPVASEGDSSSLCSPACKGEDLRMSPMVNLETAGLH